MKVGGARVVKMTVAEAEQIKTRLEKELEGHGPDAQVTTLDISLRVWQEDNLNVLKDFFTEKVVPTIRYLNMDDVIASLPTEIGLKTIQVIVDIFKDAKHLERLDANDNALGERAAEILRPLLSLPTLKSLSLSNCGMSIAVAKILVDSLLPKGREESSLTHLDMCRNQMSAEGAEELSKIVQVSPNLVYFSYSGCRALKKGTKSLISTFAEVVEKRGELKLQSLMLNDTGDFGTGEGENDSIDILLRVLPSCPHLQYLDLTDGGFGPEGTAKVIQAIQESGAQLKMLGLGGVDMREDGEESGVEALVEFLASDQCAGLEEIILDTNEFEGEGTATVIAALAKLLELRKVSIQDNLIDEAGADALLEHKIPNLEVLNLIGNDEIPEEQAKQLLRMYKGKQVLLDDDIITEEDEEEDQDEDVDNLADVLQKQSIS